MNYGRLKANYGRILCYTTGAFISYMCWRSLRIYFPSLYGLGATPTHYSTVVNETLRKNEVVKSINHHAISAIYANSLASNQPMEDRHVVHTCPTTGATMFTVIDGHGGWWCGEHVKQQISSYVMSHLHNISIKVKLEENFDKLEDVDFTATPPQASSSVDDIKRQLQQSFISLDDDISQAALADVKQVGIGRSLESQRHILTAFSGACVNTALLYGQDLYVANTGDCRCVLGQLEDGKWRAVPLSIDQAFENDDEVSRVKKAHPGEEYTVIVHKRLLGGLMPLRSFGDAMYKWSKQQLNIIYQQVPPNYLTPPYLTAEPVMTHRKLDKQDKFVVIATDGLWERLSSDEVIDIVSKGLSSSDNVATSLLKQSLGSDDETVYKLLTVDPQYSRWYRDDITIVVVVFK